MNAIMMLLLAAESAGQAPPDVLLLDFTASYCQPCQQMLPLLQRMENDGYPIQRIDITEQHNLSKQYNVERIPTLVLLVEGREVKRFQGLTSEQELRDAMRRAARQLTEAREAASGKSATAEPAPGRPLTAAAVAAPAAAEESRPAAEETVDDGQRRSISDVLKGMFRANGFEHPTVRAQSADGNSASADALAVPAAATVRVRVTGEKLQDVGTGTIVYSTKGQSIVLTCAHLFQGPGRTAQVEVDIFQNGQAARYPATIVGGNHDSDLAVLKIQNAEPLPFVLLPAQPTNLKTGQAVVSFGCDNGRPPSQLSSRILKVNQYHGPANLTCEKDPVQGRSGGGLFDEQGHLLAVCSAADRDRREGLYMSQPAIVTLLKSLKLEYVVQAAEASRGEDAALEFAAAQTTPDALLEPVGAAAVAVTGNQAPERAAAQAFQEIFEASPAVTASGTALAESAVTAMASQVASQAGPVLAATADAAAAAGSTEVTVLIDSKQPGVGKRVIVIPRATPWLLELLTGEGISGAESAQMSSAQRPELSRN